MGSKKVKIGAFLGIITLIILLIIARFLLKLSKTFFLIAGADIAGILAIFVFIIIRYRVDRRRKLLEREIITEGLELRIEYSFLRKVAGVPTKFRLKELEEATDNFKILLGQGASACVFKGILGDGTSIAVKRIEGIEHGDREFRAEVAAIASVQHVNLVRLLGYCCISGGSRFLVYEFVHNGSLDSWIFRRSAGRKREERCLPWEIRYRVAIDVAKALSYLHHDCRSRILHLDVKPENILLDENFRALVSDFGFSKMMGKDESRVVTSLRGTKGYLAPEWLLENGISEKSDIYSYGMVLLEIIGGRRNILWREDVDKSERKLSYFPKIIAENLKKGNLMEIVDERLINGGNIDEREVRILVLVALWCIQEKAKLRPSMASVVEMLQGRMAVEDPPETQMIVVDFLLSDQESMEINPNTVGVTTSRERRLESHLSSALTYSYAMSTLSGR